ncbi:MAG: radical SAM protein [Candidatus Altiarchaeota archaeon]
MADVVLFNPKFQEILKAGGIYYTCPPLDLCYIASALEQENFSVSIYDSNIEPGQCIADYVKSEKSRLLGITASSLALPAAYKALGEIHKNSEVEVVLVGQHVTEDPGILKEFGLRYGFRGYCEHGFTDLCKFLVKDVGDLSKIDGLVRNENGRITENKKKPSDFGSLAIPARHLLDLSKYKYISISASRGCPYSCSYCRSTGPFYIHASEYELRKPGDVVEEMKGVVAKYGPVLFDFVDDVFTYDKGWVRDFCSLVRNEFPKIAWTCSTRPDLLSDETVLELRNSGCFQVCIGVESGSEVVRKGISREMSDSVIRKAFRACGKAGLRARASAMIGLPGEDKDDFENTIELLKELKPTYVFLYPAILLPGSGLYELALHEGLIQEGVWARYMRGEIPLLIYLPKGIKREEISNYLRDGYRRFYLNPSYMFQRLSRARSISDVKEYLGFMLRYVQETG